MKGFRLCIAMCFCFMSASVFSAELITNNVTNQSILPPHAKLLAGNATANEFYILGKDTEVRETVAASASEKTVPVFAAKDSMMHKPIVPHAHEYASLKKAKSDVIKIEMAFNHAPQKHTYAKRAVKGHLYVSNTKHKSAHHALMG